MLNRIRDEASAQPVFYYTKLPRDLSAKRVILLDPMLATGGSAICALSKLKEHGADLGKTFFLSVVGCPEGTVYAMLTQPCQRSI
jgi:uracil phosphoribosyltransferase